MKLLMFHIILITQPLVKIITNERLIQNPSDSTIKFNALENDIRFFVKNEYQNIDSIRYQLIGYDQNPNTTLFPEIRYTQLQGGSYTINVKKYDSDKIIEYNKAKLLLNVS